MTEAVRSESAKPNPSSEWTREDRDDVVAAIVYQMVTFPKPLASKDELVEWGRKIIYALDQSPEFLELNREQLLNGLVDPSKK
jgi:hypothetical protein